MAYLHNFRAQIRDLATLKKNIISSSQEKEFDLFILAIQTLSWAIRIDNLAGTQNITMVMLDLEKAIDDYEVKNPEHMKKIIVLDDAEVCSICLQDIAVGADGVAVLKCNSHIFHQKCVGEWSTHKPNCPLCRHDMWKEPQRKRKRSHDYEKHKGETSTHLRQKIREMY